MLPTLMGSILNKIELGVVSNKFGIDKYIFTLFRRSSVLSVNDTTKEVSMIEEGRWYKVRTDTVYFDRIREYTEKCLKGGLIDINDNIY